MKYLLMIGATALVGLFLWGVIDVALFLQDFGLRGLWCGQRGCP